MNWIASSFSLILRYLKQLVDGQSKTNRELVSQRSLIESIQLQINDVQVSVDDGAKANAEALAAILKLLEPPPTSDDPDSLLVSEQPLSPLSLLQQSQGEMSMAARKATADLQVIDDGKGVLFTVQPTKAGNPVPLPANTAPAVIAVSNPALTVVVDPGDPNATPPRPADTTNLVFLGTITQPPTDAAGVVATFTYTFADGDSLVGTAAAIDIVPDPHASEPDAFVIQESNL